MSCRNCFYFDRDNDIGDSGVCTNEESLNSNQPVTGEDNCPMFTPLDGEEHSEEEEELDHELTEDNLDYLDKKDLETLKESF